MRMLHPGTEHMIFSTPDYTYVLPSAMYFTQTGPPTVAGVSANGDNTLTVTGGNFTRRERRSISIRCRRPDRVAQHWEWGGGGDTARGRERADCDLDRVQSGRTEFADPAIGHAGHVAIRRGGHAVDHVDFAFHTAGRDRSPDRRPGREFPLRGWRVTSLGFGTSDILVQRVFVLSPTHLQADVFVSPKAALSSPDVSVSAGFRSAIAPAGFNIGALAASLTGGVPTPYPVLYNAAPLLTGAYPGAIVSLFGTNLALPNSTVATVTIGGQPATILFWSPGQINFVVPPGLTPGPQTMQVNNGQSAGYAVLVNIDPPPAGINALQTTTGAYIDSTQPAYQGETLIVSLTNFAPAGAPISPERVRVSLGGVKRIRRRR